MLAGFLSLQGNFEEAEVFYLEALEGQRQVLADGHPMTLKTLGELVFLLQSQGKLAEALPLMRELLRLTPPDSAKYAEIKAGLEQIEMKMAAESQKQ